MGEFGQVCLHFISKQYFNFTSWSKTEESQDKQRFQFHCFQTEHCHNKGNIVTRWGQRKTISENWPWKSNGDVIDSFMLAVHSTILHLLPDDLPWPWVEVVWFNPAVAGSFVSVLHFSFVRGFLGSRSNEIMQIVCSAFQRNTLGSILKSLLFILHPLTLISYLTLSISCLPIFKCGDLCKLQNWPSFNFWPAVQTIWKNFEGVSFHWILGANLYICVWLSFAIFMLMEKWVERLGEGWIAGLFIVTTAGEGGIHKSPGGRRVTFLQTALPGFLLNCRIK